MPVFISYRALFLDPQHIADHPHHQATTSNCQSNAPSTLTAYDRRTLQMKQDTLQNMPGFVNASTLMNNRPSSSSVPPHFAVDTSGSSISTPLNNPPPIFAPPNVDWESGNNCVDPKLLTDSPSITVSQNLSVNKPQAPITHHNSVPPPSFLPSTPRPPLAAQQHSTEKSALNSLDSEPSGSPILPEPSLTPPPAAQQTSTHITRHNNLDPTPPGSPFHPHISPGRSHPASPVPSHSSHATPSPPPSDDSDSEHALPKDSIVQAEKVKNPVNQTDQMDVDEDIGNDGVANDPSGAVGESTDKELEKEKGKSKTSIANDNYVGPSEEEDEDEDQLEDKPVANKVAKSKWKDRIGRVPRNPSKRKQTRKGKEKQVIGDPLEDEAPKDFESEEETFRRPVTPLPIHSSIPAASIPEASISAAQLALEKEIMGNMKKAAAILGLEAIPLSSLDDPIKRTSVTPGPSSADHSEVMCLDVWRMVAALVALSNEELGAFLDLDYEEKVNGFRKMAKKHMMKHREVDHSKSPQHKRIRRM